MIQESASAGYYKVKLLNNNVTVELAAGETRRHDALHVSSK